jgi:3-hydroxyacyl-[acyl-carrier-protein] dehydratase
LRFELIDRVLSRDGSSLRAIKTVTAAEEYLADHFPDFPVLPGVMMLETLVQAARHWVAGSESPSPRPLVVSQVRNLRYGAMVRPGEALTVEVTLRKQADDQWEFQGSGTVNDQIAVQGRFTLTPMPH